MWAASCLASCCATCACSACQSVVGGISRRSARIAYCGLFALSLVLSWVLREVAAPLLESIPWINHFHKTPDREWFETDAVLRVSLGNFLFFTILAVLMLGIKDQKDPRDRIHHGGWMAKVVCWCTIVFLMFFVPNGLVSFYGSEKPLLPFNKVDEQEDRKKDEPRPVSYSLSAANAAENASIPGEEVSCAVSRIVRVSYHRTCKASELIRLLSKSRKFQEAFLRLPLPYVDEEFDAGKIWKDFMENQAEPAPYVHIKRIIDDALCEQRLWDMKSSR
ncbi:hypothetical protein J5N97_026912 [Dioscorea zingiberensis]|uniref:Uncharacterized protein n=1 Tax=Dioscorea zingiberensis TaxID=325984 RepID=A0A9D5C464_9LILI|nr:hypothetical protein J5N97_026912 [Dioscorea zingiberensis]